MGIKTVHDLKIYNQGMDLAMDIFNITRIFPEEEKYSLTSQIIRASRSIPANIREGFAKRYYENIFIRHLFDSLGSAEEVRTWLEFSLKCGYINDEQFALLNKSYEELGGMIFNTIKNWKPLKSKNDLLSDFESNYDTPNI